MRIESINSNLGNLWKIFDEYLWDIFPSEHITVDKMMIPFWSHCPFKVYMPKKHTKYCIKVYGLLDVVMAKISIRMDTYRYFSRNSDILYVDIFLKISIFLLSADAPFSPLLIGRAHLRKENAPICCCLMSTLITFKIRGLPWTLLAPLPRHHPILFTVLIPNAAEVKIAGSDGKLTQWRWPKTKKIWWCNFLSREKISLQKKLIFAITKWMLHRTTSSILKSVWINNQ